MLHLAASRGLPLPAETSREAPKCCAWQHQRGGPRNALAPASRNEPRGSQVLRLAPETRSGTVQSLKCCPLGYRPEPEVLPLPAETSREAPKCCAWQHHGGGPETRSGTVQTLKCCPCRARKRNERVCVWHEASNVSSFEHANEMYWMLWDRVEYLN